MLCENCHKELTFSKKFSIYFCRNCNYQINTNGYVLRKGNKDKSKKYHYTILKKTNHNKL